MDDVSHELSHALGVEVRLACATAPVAIDSLSNAEAEQYGALRTDLRRVEWLLGRAALKSLLPSAADTSGLTFPHASLSLTHSDGIAFAVRVEGVVDGTGIDFEPVTRRQNPRTAPFYLGPEDTPADASPADLLRLWTVKEALFKATPDNAQTVLTGFRLDSATAAAGRAAGPRGEQLSYATLVTSGGFLTVAVCLPNGAGE